MKFYHPIAFIVLLLIAGCTQPNENAVMLPNNSSFSLIAGEKLVENTPEIVDQHDTLFNSYPATVWPLYKSIIHKDYDLFIGMPIQVSLQQLAAKIAEKGIDDSMTNDSTHFLKYKRGSLHIVSVLAHHNGTFWTASAVSNNSPDIEFLFDPQHLKKRMNNESFEE